MTKVEIHKEDINVHTLFSEFLRFRNIAAEGLFYEDTSQWLTERKRAYEYFRSKFTSSSTTRQDIVKIYSEFLYFRNNKSWTTLYRTGKQALQKPQKLQSLVTRLLDEKEDIKQRINDVLDGSHRVRGIGKNIATAILHVCDRRDKYGVWNSRTEHTLGLLKRLPKLTLNRGETYGNINAELGSLKTALGTDLLTLDSFVWYVSDIVEVI